MGVYIDRDYLRSVVSEQALRNVVSARRTRGTTFSLDDPDIVADIDTAIATAESIAESKLGRRFTAAELVGLHDEVAIRQAVARIAIYQLAPSAMPRSEEIRADNDRACSFLKEIGKREYSAGASDPDPPPVLSATVQTVEAQGLQYLRSF